MIHATATGSLLVVLHGVQAAEVSCAPQDTGWFRDPALRETLRRRYAYRQAAYDDVLL